MAAAVQPIHLSGIAALRLGWRFARDPLIATRDAFSEHGPLVFVSAGLPFTSRIRAVMLGAPLVLTVGAQPNAEVLSAPETWRGVSVLPGGPKNSAAGRMVAGLPRLTGNRHAHYRKLLLQPLRRTAVEPMAARMADLADRETARWPVGKPIDLWDHVRRIMQGFSAELLFGGAGEEVCAIAELAARMMERKWGFGAFALPLNLPFTAYGRIMRESDVLERRILEWVAAKRGRPNDRDLAAIIVNSPDADGRPPDDAAIVGHIASLFALSSEGSQSALTWTLLLLAQHPRVAAELRAELKDKAGAASIRSAEMADLPYLDAVVRESMRILPPVPLQIRVAQRDTSLSGAAVPKGARVILNTLLTNRAPDLFPDGDTFRPERWFKLSPNAFEFPVFSGGPHICPGYWFGAAAIKIALATILGRFQVTLPAGSRIDYRAQPTLRPRQRVDLLLRPAPENAPAAGPVTGTIRHLIRFPQ